MNRPDRWLAIQTFDLLYMGLVEGGGKIYALGGASGATWQNTVSEYDPVTNGWSARTALPSAPVGPAAAAAPNGKIYVFNGSGADPTQVFDPATNTATAIAAPMPTLRDFAAAVAVPDGRIFVIGGSDVTGAPYSTVVDVFDTATNAWIASGPGMSLAMGRMLPAATYWNGKIYVAGGTASSDQGTTSVEVLDLATNVWSPGPPLNAARVGLGLAAAGGKIYAVGGMSRPYFPQAVVPPVYPAPIEVLDTSVPGASWVSGVSIQVPRAGGAAVALPWNGAIYFFGGATSSGLQTLSGERYFPTP